MQHISTTKGGSVIFGDDDWRSGLGAAGQIGTGTVGKKYTGNGFQHMENIDPFVMYGTLAPGWNPSSAATNASGLAGAMVAGELQNNTNAYGIDTGGKLHSLTHIANPCVVNATPHTITGTNPVGQDIVLYRRRTAADTYSTSLFYSYYNNANWNVGCVVNGKATWASATFDDTFMSGTASPALDIASAHPADGKSTEQRTMPHPMCVGSDDILYIGSGRYIHAYDGDTGTQGSFTSKVLTLPAGCQIIGIQKFNDTLLIAANYYSDSTPDYVGVGQAQLYVWNYIDADISQAIPLEDSYVASLFIWKGAPTVITNGAVERNGNLKVKVISGNSVTKIADFNGTPPVMRGVVVVNDAIYANCGGKIIGIGDKYNRSRVVNHLGTLGSPSASGFLLYNAYITTYLELLGSSSASGTHSYNSISVAIGNGAGQCQTFAYFPPFPIGKTGKITSIFVEYASTLAASGNNGTFSLTLYTDGIVSNTIVSAKSSVVAPLLKKYSLNTSGAVLPQFSSMELRFAWATSATGGISTPIISRVIVNYDCVDLAM